MTLSIIKKTGYTLIEMVGKEEAKPDEMMLSFQHMYEQLLEVVKQGETRLVFDLCETPYINSSMISLFVLAAIKTRDYSGWVKLVVPNENTRNILELVGIHRITQVFKSKDEARQQFGDM